MTLPPGHHVVRRVDGEWPKACGCGRVFSAHEWETLQFVGKMIDEVETLEMRNCPCGSTIAVQSVDEHAPTQRPSDLDR